MNRRDFLGLLAALTASGALPATAAGDTLEITFRWRDAAGHLLRQDVVDMLDPPEAMPEGPAGAVELSYEWKAGEVLLCRFDKWPIEVFGPTA